MAIAGKAAVYQSDDLRLGRRQIRLLSISTSPSPSNDIPIACSLDVVDLDCISEFYALSYTWGAPTEYGPLSTLSSRSDCPILCNGQVLCVTANLHSFLLRARQLPGLALRKFWIDAVCVNQRDKRERSEQVMLMADIYRTATVVVSWLGEQDRHTEPGFTLLAELKEVSDYAPHLLNYLSKLSPDSHEYGDDERMALFSCRQLWVSVAHVFQRTYFSRAWIIQEVVLSRTVKVLCGLYELDWSVIAEASHFFSTSGWARHLTSLFIESAKQALPWQQLSPDEHANLRFRYQSPTTLRSTAKEYKKRKQQGYQHQNRADWARTLVCNLIRARSFKATDPRDKVYALLGLVHEYAHDKPGLAPAYELSGAQAPAAAFTRAAIQILEDGDGDLLLLSCVEGEKYQQQATGRLPSWVPDWSAEAPTGLRVTGYGRYSASGGLKQRPIVERESLTLGLVGLRLDRVTMVGETKLEVLRGEPFPGWLEIVESLDTFYGRKGAEQHKLEAFWRTLIVNTAGYPPRLVPDGECLGASFGKWFRETTCRVDVDRNPDGQDGNHKWHALADRFRQSLNDLWDAQSCSAASMSEFVTPFSLSQHLRLFRTAEGYLGIGSECVEVGDSVWIVPGSCVPLLLRGVQHLELEQGQSSRDNRHRLVGGAYVHGVMEGEAVSPSASGMTTEGIQNLMETFTLE
ncbi:HET-domain-containing protein [Parathielavia appendiculata]|uniref:HET-domain-containing protein n=1 Tax=Parathielavia appendiculata TaxID=2587402 RepID=A0AAN6Z1G9_9PEZI|nr:HET-domain-containing protein [Parathielavia appendiculata]